jgi:phosphoribosylanthranilate isomerase
MCSEWRVIPDIKFCGMTRPTDARFAAELGAAYVGVIFAGGPRQRTIEQARVVLSGLPSRIKRVGVFGPQRTEEIAAIASALELDVLQLHDRGDPETVDRLRALTWAELWSVLRLSRGFLPENSKVIADAADAIVLDTYIPGVPGGTGVALPWHEIAGQLEPIRSGRLVLAGGLRPENVAMAIAHVAPDVVDVSSGVEGDVGIKDHERMRAFRDAVIQASIPTP